jgi:hypothetical protein
MIVITTLGLVVSAIGVFTVAWLHGCMVGMRVTAEIWAPKESYDEMYGPEGTIRPGRFETFLFKVMRR